MRAIGYRELFQPRRCGRDPGNSGDLCSGGQLRDISERIKLDTRRYAKRQMTFFRNLPGVEWISPDPGDFASRVAAVAYPGSSAL